MRIHCLVVFSVLFGACLYASAVTRIILGDTSASASSTYSTDRAPQYAVNGDGLYGNAHTNQPSFAMWMSAVQAHTISGQWFRVDLGHAFELDHFKLWNFNFWHATAWTTNRGIREAEVYVSHLDTDPGSDFSDATKWTRLIDTVTFAKAPGSNTYEGEPDVSLNGAQGRWLALRVLSNFSTTDLSVGISELQVFAADKPVVIPQPPTTVTYTHAILPGVLSYDNGQSNTVYAFWGTADGGTVSSAWQHVSAVGYQPSGAVFNVTAPVSANAEYRFRFHTVNTVTDNWSDAESFITAPVTVETPTAVSESAEGWDVIFRRPEGLTGAALPLTFSFSGTAVAGNDYTSPGTDSLLMPAGSATAQTHIVLLDDFTDDADKTVTIALQPGPYVPDTVSTGTTVIVDDEGALDRYDWQHTLRVDFSGYAGTSTLTNFPVPIRLHEGLPGFRYADFASPSDGGDLRVTDAATGEAVPYEIETWDPSGTSVIWTCVAHLSGSDSAVNLLWGNTNMYLPNYTSDGTLWASGFGGVWHLQQTNAADSTANGNTGTAVGNQTVPGLIGKGQSFNGSNNYITVPDSPSIGTNVVSSLTLSMWLKSDAPLLHTNELWRMLEKGDDYFLCQGFYNQGGAVLIIKHDNLVHSIGNGADVAANEWHFICGTYDSTTLRFYFDGTPISSVSFSDPIDDDQLPLRIGSDDSGKFFKGILDETRIESAVRSADWVKACYDSQCENSTFLTYHRAFSLIRGTILCIH